MAYKKARVFLNEYKKRPLGFVEAFVRVYVYKFCEWYIYFFNNYLFTEGRLESNQLSPLLKNAFTILSNRAMPIVFHETNIVNRFDFTAFVSKSFFRYILFYKNDVFCEEFFYPKKQLVLLLFGKIEKLVFGLCKDMFFSGYHYASSFYRLF